MALFSPPLPPTYFSVKPHFNHKSTLFLPLNRPSLFLSTPKSLPDNGVGAGTSASVAAVEDSKAKQKDPVLEKSVEEESVGSNGSATTSTEVELLSKFEDPRWIAGTWDLKQFLKDGSTDWDAVIDAGKIFFFISNLIASRRYKL